MLDYLFLEIAQKVYRKLPNIHLTLFEKGFFLFILFYVLFTFFSPQQLNKYRPLFYGVYLCVIFIFFIYEYIRDQKKIIERRNLYYKYRILPLKKILRKQVWGLYTPDGISYLKHQCIQKIEKRNKLSLPSLSSLILVPFTMDGIQILIKQENVQKLFLFIVAICIIIFIVCLFSLFVLLYWEFFAPVKISVYKSLLKDLEYLELNANMK